MKTKNNAQGEKRTGSKIIACSQILILIIIIAIFFYFSCFTKVVSAQEDIIANSVCCEKTSSGSVCQFVPKEQCSLGLGSAPTECENTDFCKMGCCYSDNTGLCNKNTPKISCQESGGNWKEDASCNIMECQKGCCILGRNVIFTTEKNCQFESRFLGLEGDFRNEIKSEVECIFLTEKSDEGACVFEKDTGNTCKFTTRESCDTMDGSFYKNTFCSDSQLNTTCKAKDHTGCIEGKEEVYWLDSCGNLEDIYEDCDLFAGNYCGIYRPEIDTKPINGDYICRNSDCKVEISEEKVTKKHGESWCEYEGTVGDGRDIVGSRHIKHICILGEERIEPCADYRNQVCLQAETKSNDSKTYTEAQCIPNSWLQCLDYNKETDLAKLRGKCSNNSLCFIKSVYVDEYFQFDYCSPMFPPGFDFKSEDSNHNGEDVCKLATQTCNVIYVKDIFGRWRLDKNRECLSVTFTEQMNDICSSLGDCGAYVNIAGDFTDEGYSVSRAPRLGGNAYIESKKKYISYSGPFTDQAIDIGLDFLNKYPKLTLVGDDKKYYGYVTTIKGLGTLSHQAEKNAEKEYKQSAEYWFAGPGPQIFDIVDTKTKKVTFTCLPWQAPYGGTNCDLCNTKDSLGVPCTKYRCSSLGQTCEFINEGSEYESCVDVNPNDVSSPKITPLYNNISEGYKYLSVSDNNFELKTSDNNCIPEFTPVEFGIETDKPAQCKIGTNLTQSYDEMEVFGGNNFYIKEHKMTLNIPSPEAFKNQYNLTEEEIENLGKLNLYVKCKSYSGAVNTAPFIIKTCVEPGPDLTAPRITKVVPETGYVKYGETQKEIQIYTNEPSDCKWSAESNKEYADMENSMSCLNDLEDYGLFGWTCNTTLTGLDNKSRVYIKCKDQPWLPEENQNRNAMTENFEYNLQVSKNPLIIEDFRPENEKEIWFGVEPVSFELKVKTSGGVDGTSTCKWEGNSYSDRFIETNAVFHSYKITSATRGTYDIKFTCEDKAGNIAENSTSFTIKIDSQGPRITRIFYSGGLKIVTDENAECRYALSSKTNWENSTIMSGAGLEHTSDWQLKTYYVQCSDEYGNKGGKTRVRPYSII